MKDRRRRLRDSPLALGLLVVVVVNLILLSAYVWSHGGQAAKVRVAVKGDDYAGFADGRFRAQATFAGPPAGGIMLMIPDSDALPGLPTPRGIDSVRVRDFDSGRVLFEDDFDELDGGVWEVIGGSFVAKDGVLVADSRQGPGAWNREANGPWELPEGYGLTTAYSDCHSGFGDRRTCGYGRSFLLLRESWTDYTVEVTFRNVIGAFVAVRVDDSAHPGIYDGVYYGSSMTRYYFSDLGLIMDNELLGLAPGMYVEFNSVETLKSITAMVVTPYPYLLLLLLAGAAAVAVLSLAPVGGFGGVLRGRPELLLVGGLVIAAFAVTLFVNARHNTFMPHIPDELCYIFQAKLLASGHVTGKIPAVEEAFTFWNTPFLYTNGERWASFYPFGHPLMLAIGEVFGALRLMPSLVGAGCVALVYLAGRRMYGGGTALLAAALLLSSPFFLMTTSNFMSHNTAAFYMLVSLLFILKRERPLLYGLIAGVFFGLLFNTRPLTALSLVPGFGALLLLYLVPHGDRRAALVQGASFAVGGLLMLGAYYLYNYGITGDPFRNPYEAGGSISTWLGFSGRHTLELGLQNEQTDLATLVLVLNGWPRYLGLFFVMLPFVIGTRNRWDYFCLACALLQTGSLVLYEAAGIMHGPRYWYESLPFFILLSARGVQCAIGLFIDLASAARRRLSTETRPAPRWAGALVVYVFLAILVVYGTGGWLFGFRHGWEQRNMPFVPQTASGMRDIMGMQDRLVKLSKDEDLDNALVIVDACDGWWSCYGSVFWLNAPDFNGNVVWAKDVGERTADVIAAYPGRKVYYATWDPPSLRAYVPRPPVSSGLAGP